MTNFLNKMLLATAGTLLALSVSTSSMAAENLFGFTKLNSADQQVIAMAEGKCGGSKDAGKKMEGKCGGSKDAGKKMEGKCGGSKDADKKMEGKCGGSKDAGKKMEGKCGAGKCGGK